MQISLQLLREVYQINFIYLEVFRAGVPNSERNALIRNAWNWDKYEYETSWNAPEVFQNVFERILFHY